MLRSNDDVRSQPGARTPRLKNKMLHAVCGFSQSVQPAHFVVLIHIMYMFIAALTSDYGAPLAASSLDAKVNMS